MRIIAGSLKGRRLRSPGWPGLRPTSDRLRETLFNILGDRVRGADVLDACAGTGALGLEALSRGARTVTFVDADRRSAAYIADHAERFGVADACRIVCARLPGAAADRRLQAAFDLILLDPPYDNADTDAILSAVGARLAAGGVLVLERARRAPPPNAEGLTAARRVVAGDSALEFYAPAEAGG